MNLKNKKYIRLFIFLSIVFSSFLVTGFLNATCYTYSNSGYTCRSYWLGQDYYVCYCDSNTGSINCQGYEETTWPCAWDPINGCTRCTYTSCKRNFVGECTEGSVGVYTSDTKCGLATCGPDCTWSSGGAVWRNCNSVDGQIQVQGSPYSCCYNGKSCTCQDQVHVLDAYCTSNGTCAIPYVVETVISNCSSCGTSGWYNVGSSYTNGCCSGNQQCTC